MELTKKRGELSMFQLSLPLVLEQFFRILVSSADTMMLASYSETAVAGVGLMAQWSFFMNILFNVIATGSSIVLAQYLGAEKSRKELTDIAKASTVMITAISLILMLAVIFGTGTLLSFYTLEEEVRIAAHEYFVIFCGFGSFFIAFSTLQSAILRCYGYTREAMIVTIIANLINIIGNALSLYGFFGLPILGVKGVAAASLVSQIASFIILTKMIYNRKDIAFDFNGLFKTPKKIFKMILSIGIPTASENLSYNVSQIVIMAMISTLGTIAMTAQIYTRTICQYVFVIASGVGSACQIKAGYFVGAGKSEEGYRKVFKYSLVATSCSLFVILLVNLFHTPIISFFTKRTDVFESVRILLLWSIYLEIGRSLNLIWVGALKGAGDVKFPVFYGMFSNWSIMVLGSYILGLKMGFGVTGCWIGIGTDEFTRGIVMLLRWKSKRWMTKSLISKS